MARFFHVPAALLSVVLLVAGCDRWDEPPTLTTKHLIVEAAQTIERFRVHKDLKNFTDELDRAAAVVVLPNVIKAGFFAGGEAGNGVLLKKTADGWSYPAFYTLGAASFGLQVGVQDTAIVLILRNPGALDSVLRHQGKIGADTGATVFVQGVGMEASTTTNLGADILAFANSNVGAYLGASLEGAVLATRHDLNRAYYGQEATPDTILSGQSKNPDADPLKRTLGGG